PEIHHRLWAHQFGLRLPHLLCPPCHLQCQCCALPDFVVHRVDLHPDPHNFCNQDPDHPLLEEPAKQTPCSEHLLYCRYCVRPAVHAGRGPLWICPSASHFLCRTCRARDRVYYHR